MTCNIVPSIRQGRYVGCHWISLFLRFIFILCVCFPACMSMKHMVPAEAKNRVSDTLERELKTFFGFCVGSAIQIQVL